MSPAVPKRHSGKPSRAPLGDRRQSEHGYTVKKAGKHWLISIAGAGLLVCATRNEALRVVRAAAELLKAPVNKT
jgi:hypothetical protein